MSRKLLVVDDEIEFCKVLNGFLTGKGYIVTEAYDGVAAIAAYKADRPGAVLLDERMPGKRGMEVLKELKAFDPEANVMLITAILDNELMREAIAAGAFDYTFKPINLAALELALRLRFEQIDGGKK